MLLRVKILSFLTKLQKVEIIHVVALMGFVTKMKLGG